MGVLKWILKLVAISLVVAGLWLLFRGRAHAQASCATTYTAACIGSTVCFTATGTSLQALPPDLNRRYLLIQGKSPTNTVSYAIGPNAPSNSPIIPGNPPPTPIPLIAVLGVNTIDLVPPGNGQLPNYEVSSLNATATPPPRVPSGAVSVITSGASVNVCFTESNG